MLKNSKKFMVLSVTMLIVLVFDQLTKILIRLNFDYAQVKEIVPNFFNLTYRLNPGVAFSLGSNLSIAPYLFSALAVAAIVYIYWLVKKSDDLNLMGVTTFGLIAGGALGNTIDRLIEPHKVVDFLDFYFKNYHWPAFNIADSAICIGAGLLMLGAFFSYKKVKK